MAVLAKLCDGNYCYISASISESYSMVSLENPIIINLLLRIQMLSMIRDGAVPVALQHEVSKMEPELI